MLELKARLWTHGNTDELLRRAIASYREPIELERSAHCSHCGQTAAERLDTFETDNGVTIDGVPTLVCEHCGNRSWDLLLVGKLEEMVLHRPTGTKITLDEMLTL
ncbi:hypothetical protein IW967_00915 [Alicyclobacillus mali]|uniref:YgiT-type zinc finger domain-containing protein n=1 Tax=Alicyclobacillus mali (ex Roth et al. 2021) TaxID=1123961 RepID=A0ABS0EZI0_9BACL|nr:hypothetical protein [Alicyclobacillus mali (ex Roth et al. 2021)]MBF8376450.1 hypothetical protein [Alicyclobacillus mali (ex Roth et al. 2021)]